MRILMLGNSLTSAQDMPDILAELTGAEVVCHTRGGARLSEHLNPNTRLGARTQAALAKEQWDYVVLQEMSHGPITAPGSFFASVERLCRQIRENGAIPVLYATWAYQKGGARLSAKGWDYGGMARNLSAAYRRAAEENRALLADVGRRFYQLPGTQDLYAADLVHDRGERAAGGMSNTVLQPACPARPRRKAARAKAVRTQAVNSGLESSVSLNSTRARFCSCRPVRPPRKTKPPWGRPPWSRSSSSSERKCTVVS